MKLIIADGNSLMRVGLKSVLSTLPDSQIVFEATTSDELLNYVKSNDADIVIIDYTSEGFEIDIIPKVLQKKSTLKFVAVTPEQSAHTLIDALKSGVQSYVKKDCDLEEILDAVRDTFEGKKFFCGKILETIQRASIDVNDIDFEAFSCHSVSLSEREVQIIKMIADGQTNTQIAEELFLSNHTVNTHRKNILSKLGVKNTAGIVMYAVKTNLVSPNKFLFSGEN